MTPRVLLAADSLLAGANGIGRVARLTAKLLAELARAGEVEARAITLRDEARADLGLPTKVFQGSRARFVLECQRAALRCTHFVYDFAGMARAHPHWMRPRRRSMVWVHGIEAWEDARPDRLRALAKADVLIANTVYTRARASSLHSGFLRAHTCWLGTETDAAPAQPRGPSTNVLLLGRIDPNGGEKGHRELIDCWPAVLREVPNARLRFAGAGPAESLVRAWVASSPARDRIDVLGFVPEAELPVLWSNTAVFAMPARGEGLGLAYLEAMRSGVPVIASLQDAGAEINVDGVTGYNVDLERPGELPARIVELLRDGPLRERMGAEGRARWRDHFSYSKFRERFLPILRTFLHEP